MAGFLSSEFLSCSTIIFLHNHSSEPIMFAHGLQGKGNQQKYAERPEMGLSPYPTYLVVAVSCCDS